MWPFKSKPEARFRVLLQTGGFRVERDDKPYLSVPWANVAEIIAYKEDLLTVDRICLGFRMSGESDYLCVDEEMDGYKALVVEIERRYPDHTKDWWNAVAFPAFETNRTVIWTAESQRT